MELRNEVNPFEFSDNKNFLGGINFSSGSDFIKIRPLWIVKVTGNRRDGQKVYGTLQGVHSTPFSKLVGNAHSTSLSPEAAFH